MNIKAIKTSKDYSAAIQEIERLMYLKPRRDSNDWNKLEVLTTLANEYERNNFPLDNCDPIDAIKLVMDQKSLQHSDLIPYIGSRSKVSEVLSGKRTLSLNMIKALHEGLGIPAKILIGSSTQDKVTTSADCSFTRETILQLINRGWSDDPNALVETSLDAVAESMYQRMEKLFSYCVAPVLPRLTGISLRFKESFDETALLAWQALVIEKAIGQTSIRKMTQRPDESLLRSVVALSIFSDGPLRVVDFLSESGIMLVVEPPLPKTYIDGGAILLKSGNYVVGLTLRHDRLDNFWFTLLHELVHVLRHLNAERPIILDDLDTEARGNIVEEEADNLAREALIPSKKWNSTKARKIYMNRAGLELYKWALDLNVHPAILAGRIRYEFQDYRVFSAILGVREPSRLLLKK